MGKITAIEEQKRNKKRFNIYIDDDFAFGVHEDVLVWHRLTVGQELSHSFIDDVLLAEEQSKANNYALKILGYRVHSEFELRNKLNQKGYEGRIIDETILYLKRNKLVDDYAFALALVNDERKKRLSGSSLIEQKLLLKGVSRESIKRALEENADDGETPTTCMALAEKKLRTSYRNDTQKDKIRKVSAFLQRKGYPYDIIEDTIKKLLVSDWDW